MIRPGVKFRVGDRWIIPQLHESLFRPGEGGGSGPAVVAGSAVSNSAQNAGTLTIASYATPASMRTAAALLVFVDVVQTANAGVTSVTWNSQSLTEVATITAASTNSSCSLFYLQDPALNTTSDIVADFDAASVSFAVISAVLVEGADESGPVTTDDSTATNTDTSSVGFTTSEAGALLLDYLSVFFAGSTPAPTADGPNAEIPDSSQSVDDGLGNGLLGIGSSIETGAAGAYTLGWSGLSSIANEVVHLGVEIAPYDATPDPTQPVTAKLVLGYDFSGNDSVVTVTGVGISLVTDSSGNANDGSQATDSRRLLYGSATINGELAGDSAADTTKNIGLPASITGWAANGQPPLHILLVCQVTTWTTGRSLVSFQTGGGAPRVAIRLSTSGGNRFEMRSPTAVPGSSTTLSTETTLTTATTYLVELGIDASTASLTVNEGTPATVAAAPSGEALSNRRLFDLSVSADAKVGALYIFNDALSGAELAEWRTFLKARWGYV